MNYELTYTVRKALEAHVPEFKAVKLIYDGVDLTNVPKPYATVELYDVLTEEQSAGHESFHDEYLFQVGIFANDVNELHRLQAKVRKVIRSKYGHEIYVIDEETNKFVKSDTFIPWDDRGFTPMTSNDSSEVRNAHRGYFDVAIEIY